MIVEYKHRTETSLLFTVNLAVIKYFYDTTNLTLKGAKQFLTRQIPNLAPLQWTLFSKNTSRLLAGDTVNSYSLTNYANQIQNESEGMIVS